MGRWGDRQGVHDGGWGQDRNAADRHDRQRLHREVAPSGPGRRSQRRRVGCLQPHVGAPRGTSPAWPTRWTSAPAPPSTALPPWRPPDRSMPCGSWRRTSRACEVMEEIHALQTSGRARLAGVACEKPLARTVSEARQMLRLAEDAGLNHGYLENQVFSHGGPARQGDHLAPRRADQRQAVPGARCRGTQRAARAVVLAGIAARRRRAAGHDVPLLRGRPLPADRARRARAAR